MILIVIDEVETFVIKTQLEALFDIFALPYLKKSRVILITISNTVNLTYNYLPDLKLRDINPIMLTFKPYTDNQLIEILGASAETPAKPEKSPDIAKQGAVAWAAKKIGATSGDVRAAFDVLGKREDISAVVQISRKYYANNVQGVVDEIPHHQRVVLASIIITLSLNDKNNIGQVYAKYSAICRQVNIDKVPFGDF